MSSTSSRCSFSFLLFPLLHGLALGFFVWFFRERPWADSPPVEMLLFFACGAGVFLFQILLLLSQARFLWKASAASSAKGGGHRNRWVRVPLFLMCVALVLLTPAFVFLYEAPVLEQLRYALERAREDRIVKASYGNEERGYLYGAIDWGLAAQTERFLAESEGITTLHVALEEDPPVVEPGHFLEEKLPAEFSALLFLLRERDVTTATDVCAGICAFAFLGGQSRSGDMKTVLEFHPLPDELMPYEEQEAFLKETGISGDALRKIMAATPGSPWQPTLEEMRDEGILTLLPFEREKLFHALFPMASSARKALEQRFSALREKSGSDTAAWREIIEEGFLLTVLRLLPYAPSEQIAVFAAQLAEMNRSLLLNEAAICEETHFSFILQLPYDDAVDPFLFQQHRNLLADILDMMKEAPSIPSTGPVLSLLRPEMRSPDRQELRRMERSIQDILDNAPNREGNVCALRAFLYDEIARLPAEEATVMIVSIRSLALAKKQAEARAETKSEENRDMP